MKMLRHHFFVCTGQRPPGRKASCGDEGKNAQEIFQKLVDAVNENMLWYEILVTSSNCIGPCGEGPNIVVYPDTIWYTGVTPDDVNEIVEKHMLNGQPVERLIFEWPEQYQL
jgi:(2Fe-2S) ferredoxin